MFHDVSACVHENLIEIVFFSSQAVEACKEMASQFQAVLNSSMTAGCKGSKDLTAL